MDQSSEKQKLQATVKALNELKEKVEQLFSKDKLHDIQMTITTTIEETHAAVGSRIDAEMKKTLKGTMHLLKGAKSELDGIQKKIVKLMSGKKKTSKKPAKRKSPAAKAGSKPASKPTAMATAKGPAKPKAKKI
jgi:N-methylhydantoinase B/oxoprolinase/acetone carboxylase alpha subunit